MAKKKKKSAAPLKRLRKQVKDLRDIEKRVKKVRNNLQRFLDRGPGGGHESLK